MFNKSALAVILSSLIASPALAQYDYGSYNAGGGGGGGNIGNFRVGPNGVTGNVNTPWGRVNVGPNGVGFRGNGSGNNGSGGGPTGANGRGTYNTDHQAIQDEYNANYQASPQGQTYRTQTGAQKESAGGFHSGGGQSKDSINGPMLPPTQTTQYGVGPGMTTDLRHLPPTMLDSFVRNSTNPEAIYGDEGTNGPPPIDGFNYENTIGSGLPGAQTMLSTGHASVLPSAWLDSDGFSGGMTGRNSGFDGMSGTGMGDFGDFSGFGGPGGIFGQGDLGAMGRPDLGLGGRAPGPGGGLGNVVPEGPASHPGGERMPAPGLGDFPGQ
jgi:hypothetical protein